MKHSLDSLARKAGIQESYTDIWGKEVHVPERTKKAILAAMKIDGEPDCPEIHVVAADTPCTCIIHGQSVALPALPMGYHDRHVNGHPTTIIAAPARCWLPDELAAGKRIWGVSAQLYSLQSERNWGIGDFTDLAELAARTAQMGADVLGVNPFHASYPNDPRQFSPYAPSNREFLNYLYIDVTRLPGCEADISRLDTARSASLVDYAQVASLKKAALESCFAHFIRHGNRADFDAFKQAQGKPLMAQAAFDALSEHFSDAGWYGDWPAAYQSPTSPEVEAFCREHAERVEFYCWLQYTADLQLAQAQRHARDSGMMLGLYRDLAVGSATHGAETWLHPSRFVRGVTVGAPPDTYNARGQDWGLPPFNPLVMRQEGMKPLIDLLRANMRHAGALRIDHAFGLSRLFWVPEGMAPTEGAYVEYPFEAMLAVLRVESHLNRCLVIGEDLGTFPPGYKEQANASGVLSYRLLYFEREADGGFIHPENYPSLALASISTHDLPTLAGWQAEWDIDLKAELDLYPEPQMAEDDRSARKEDVARLHEALAAQNLEGGIGEAAQLYLARSPAMLVMVQLEDILGIREQVNMPATTDEHPNWQRKLPIPIERICADNGPLVPLAQKITQERRRPGPAHPLATYRLQLHEDFTFRDTARILPYLKRLGVSHVYTSPITMARPGSTHGYDVIDYTRLNPELGGEKGFAKFRAALEENGLRHLLDFVSNHMGTGPANGWWQDVLAHGPQSRYACYFDIDWREKLLLPVLGKAYEDVLAAGELEVTPDGDNGYVLTYHDHRFALHPDSHAEAQQAMENPGMLAALVERQCYRLAHWREAAEHINYRRFFEINDLAAVRVEDPVVFESVHGLIFDLLDKDKLDALRIDHIDGLADPEGYCRNLQRRAGPNRYLVVEKILGEGEELPLGWPVAGTTGYDMLNRINGLFVQPEQEAEFDRIYREFTGNTQNFAQVLHETKRQVLRESFGSELRALVHEARRNTGGQTDMEQLHAALLEIIVHFPVYRSYATDRGMSEQDGRYIRQALEAADISPSMRPAMTHLFEKRDETFLRRFQQLTGPAMAKGLEDTGFYRYHRFVSLNEVGGNPGVFGLTTEQFHRLNKEQQQRWPHSMVATATHDTKRGEDMRARLNVLSTIPDAWESAVYDWRERLVLPLAANDLYFLFQTLVGSWPLELLETPLPQKPLNNYRDRLCAYMVKALREGKERSSWLTPDESYEDLTQKSIHTLLALQDFLAAFLPFTRKVAEAGIENSLAQIALKCTLPGVPDIYQGTEFWDFSLVDPDNRRPVNYRLRSKRLTQSTPIAMSDASRKQSLLTTLLQHRRRNRALYAYGEYIPLQITGADAGRVVAYARYHDSRHVIIILSRYPTGKREPDAWHDTRIILPGDIPSLIDIVHRNPIQTINNTIEIREIPQLPAILENPGS